MSRYRWVLHYAPLLILLLAGVAGSGCTAADSPQSPGQEDSTRSLTQADGGEGGVTFQATVVTSEYMTEHGHLPDHLGFLVSLDTHSGSLFDYDLAALGVLRDDSGRVAQASGWEAISNDSHHRSGLLYFDGLASLAADGQYMELALKNVGGVPERVLRWSLPLPSS